VTGLAGYNAGHGFQINQIKIRTHGPTDAVLKETTHVHVHGADLSEETVHTYWHELA